MATRNKFIKHFRDLQAGESKKAGAAETLAYLNGSCEFLVIIPVVLRIAFLGELSFQEYEKRVREVNTDYSNVSVGKVLDTREAEIVDIDKLIDELSDIDDLSGLSSSHTSDNSDEEEKSASKKRKKDQRSKGKRRRRKNDPNLDDEEEEEDEEEENDDEDDDEEVEKVTDPTELRNKMVRHLEEMRLAKQKLKRSNLLELPDVDFHLFISL